MTNRSTSSTRATSRSSLKALSAFGGVYATCWLGYVAADVFIIDPTGAITSNSGIVGFIGVSSVAQRGLAVRDARREDRGPPRHRLRRRRRPRCG